MLLRNSLLMALGASCILLGHRACSSRGTYLSADSSLRTTAIDNGIERSEIATARQPLLQSSERSVNAQDQVNICMLHNHRLPLRSTQEEMSMA